MTSTIYITNKAYPCNLKFDTTMPEGGFKIKKNESPIGTEPIPIITIDRSDGIKHGDRYGVAISMRIGNMDINFVISLLGLPIFGSMMGGYVTINTLGKMQRVDFGITKSHTAITVRQPLVNGRYLDYRFELIREGDGLSHTTGNVKLAILPQGQGTNSPDTLVRHDLASPAGGFTDLSEEELLDIPSEIDGDMLDGSGCDAPSSDTPLGKRVNASSYPYRAVGKLYVHFDGKRSMCSGALVAPDIVLTCAHCLFVHSKTDKENGQWIDRVTFIPGYSTTHRRPQYHGIELLAPTGFIQDENYEYDMAIIKLRGKAAKLHEVLPMRCCDKPTRTGESATAWQAVGYPRCPDYYPPNADEMFATTGSFSRFVKDKQIMIMNHNDLGKGASGGPWMLGLEDGYAINGIGSQHDSLHPLEKRSPYLGVAANSLRYASQNGFALV